MSAPNDFLLAPARPQRTPWWQPWVAVALFSFMLHFVWEMLQVPLYRTMSDIPHWEGIWKCTRASIGDVALTPRGVLAGRGRASERRLDRSAPRS